MAKELQLFHRRAVVLVKDISGELRQLTGIKIEVSRSSSSRLDCTTIIYFPNLRVPCPATARFCNFMLRKFTIQIRHQIPVCFSKIILLAIFILFIFYENVSAAKLLLVLLLLLLLLDIITSHIFNTHT